MQRAINQTLEPIMLSDGKILGAAGTLGSEKDVLASDAPASAKGVTISEGDHKRYVVTGMIRLVEVEANSTQTPAADLDLAAKIEPSSPQQKGGK